MFHGLDRRKFVLNGSVALAGLAPANAQTAGSALVTHRLNNVMIAVSDFDKSVDFYQKLFGAASIDGDVAIIRVAGGPHFLGLTQVKDGDQPGFLSYGLTMDNFDPSGIAKSLNTMNVKYEETNRAGTPELWIYDPTISRFNSSIFPMDMARVRRVRYYCRRLRRWINLRSI